MRQRNRKNIESMDIKTIEQTYLIPTYKKLPLTLTRGKGAYVWDEKGTKYLDFYGGHAVCLIGHCHPLVITAIKRQLEKLIFYSNLVYQQQRAEAAKQLVKAAPLSFSQVFFLNSGTEANEAALKVAKKFTGKEEIISFTGSFHGRTIGSLSVTGIKKYKQGIKPLMGKVKFAQFGLFKSVEKLITPNTAAVIIEPIQSMAGVNEAKSQFFKDLRQLCDEKEIILIFDEIQTGLGRTGRMFIGEHWQVTPDIITLGKGLAGGLPASSLLLSKKIAQSVKIGDQGSTFGGGPVVCAAISATLKVIEQQNLVKNAAKQGQYLKKEILKLPKVINVTGKGLLLGVLLSIKAAKLQEKLLDKKIITGTSQNPNVLRLLPPLIISQKETEVFLDGLSKALKKF